MSIKNNLLNWLLGKDRIEEVSVLNQWKKEAEDNIRKLSVDSDMDSLIEDLKSYKTVDKGKAWTNVAIRQPSIKAIRTFSSFQKVAAVFLVVLFSIIGFRIFTNKNSPPFELLAQNSILETTLEDGTSVVLDNQSELKVFEDRRVELRGRCFFDVVKNPLLPFKVHMHHGVLEVLGTQFIISTQPHTTTVYVSEGKVQINYNAESWQLRAGDKIVMSNEEIVMQKVARINPKSWASHQLVFKDESLKVVLNTLSLHYNLALFYAEDIFEKDVCKINTAFSDTSLENILEELALITGLKYQIDDKNIVILSFKC